MRDTEWVGVGWQGTGCWLPAHSPAAAQRETGTAGAAPEQFELAL